MNSKILKRSKNLVYYKKINFTNSFVNPRLINAEYSVRGTVAIKSGEYAELLKKGEKLKFNKLYSLNIGNPQALDQKPITFPREVVSSLFDSRFGTPDSINRSKTYLNEIKSVEHYTDYRGMKVVRDNIAQFINERDDIDTVTSDNIILTNGAGGGIRLILETIVNNPKDSIMIPIPQYPLYTALISLFGCQQAPYYLDEENGWSLDINDLHRSYKEQVDKGNTPKALVVINPGNPTGNVLTKKNLIDIIKFCYDHHLIILSDEVYQVNIYNPKKKFYSMRKVLETMSYPYRNTTVVSFHSTSKGVFGECGLRGGYLDMANVPDEIVNLMLKLKILDVCPNIAGQVVCDVMVKPPTLENASSETVNLFNSEHNKLFENLKEKADILSKQLNNISRINSQRIDGAMYAFPKIDMPDFRIAEAEKLGIPADMNFCLKLLEHTGIVTVPGSGFGQKQGTHHFRLTNLINPKEEMVNMVEKMKSFCDDYFSKDSKI